MIDMQALRDDFEKVNEPNFSDISRWNRQKQSIEKNWGENA